ncbi:10943_t:CDS:1, partial [Dentiscutata erythropus]
MTNQNSTLLDHKVEVESRNFNVTIVKKYKHNTYYTLQPEVE